MSFYGHKHVDFAKHPVGFRQSSLVPSVGVSCPRIHMRLHLSVVFLLGLLNHQTLAQAITGTITVIPNSSYYETITGTESYTAAGTAGVFAPNLGQQAQTGIIESHGDYDGSGDTTAGSFSVNTYLSNGSSTGNAEGVASLNESQDQMQYQLASMSYFKSINDWLGDIDTQLASTGFDFTQPAYQLTREDGNGLGLQFREADDGSLRDMWNQITSDLGDGNADYTPTNLHVTIGYLGNYTMYDGTFLDHQNHIFQDDPNFDVLGVEDVDGVTANIMSYARTNISHTVVGTYGGETFENTGQVLFPWATISISGGSIIATPEVLNLTVPTTGSSTIAYMFNAFCTLCSAVYVFFRLTSYVRQT